MQEKIALYIILNGILTTARYVNEILGVYVRPYAGAIVPDFILMDDNARQHRARVTNKYMQTAALDRMDSRARWGP